MWRKLSMLRHTQGVLYLDTVRTPQKWYPQMKQIPFQNGILNHLHLWRMRCTEWFWTIPQKKSLPLDHRPSCVASVSRLRAMPRCRLSPTARPPSVWWWCPWWFGWRVAGLLLMKTNWQKRHSQELPFCVFFVFLFSARLGSMKRRQTCQEKTGPMGAFLWETCWFWCLDVFAFWGTQPADHVIQDNTSSR